MIINLKDVKRLGKCQRLSCERVLGCASYKFNVLWANPLLASPPWISDL